MSDLPRPVILAAFRRGLTPAAIAAAFGVEHAKDVVDELVAAMRDEGMDDAAIGTAFGEVWLGETLTG